MRRLFLFAAAAAILSPTAAEARWRRSPAPSRSCGTSPVPAAPIAEAKCPCETAAGTAPTTGTAQAKAELQAMNGRMAHVGTVPAGCHEGVGFSTASADAAIRNCCYWGRLPVREIGVARGRLGFYATVIYGR
ncbi:MAG: hypothetical protein KF873_02085 [Gemmataceae bacterium]|nr:hypothetical protein [Gemmataceae bacterium]